MSSQRNLPQSKEALLKSYTTRLKEDVKSMLENFEGKNKFHNICRIKQILWQCLMEPYVVRPYYCSIAQYFRMIYSFTTYNKKSFYF